MQTCFVEDIPRILFRQYNICKIGRNTYIYIAAKLMEFEIADPDSIPDLVTNVFTFIYTYL